MREEGSRYFSISPLMLYPETLGSFSVYLKQGERFVLYTGDEEQFSERHRRTLHDNGVGEVFVQAEQREAYTDYVERHLGQILSDESIPLESRSNVFYSTSASIVEEVFETRLPEPLKGSQFKRILHFVERGTQFLSRTGTLEAVGKLMSHDYYTYTHCVHVFVYATAILNSYGVEESIVLQSGLGAVLHDLGKQFIPADLLNKEGALEEEEWEVVKKHPLFGVTMCREIPLGQDAHNCILFHHERMNGTGYPSGLSSADLPFPVRAVTIADVYDALTTKRSYAAAMTPYEALTIMRNDMTGFFDEDMFRRFIEILSGANLMDGGR